MNCYRKRKPRNPCSGCYLHPNLCMCSLIPNLDLKTRVTIIVHASELKKTTNTGRLALMALKNSALCVRGGDAQHSSPIDLSPLLTSDYQTIMFYPSHEAVELNQSFLATFDKPIQLLIPDGTWRQARKVHTRHHELNRVPRAMITSPNPFKVHMRAESTDYGMATLLAIASALGVIEGEQVRNVLFDLYKNKLERTLQGRGLLKPPV